MRLFDEIIFSVAFIMFAGVATAKIDECQPNGMLDAEAARIIAIATEQGKAFRAAIDALRAGGVSYYDDTTYDDLMADPERAIALVREHFGFKVYFSYPIEYAQDSNVDDIISPRLSEWINRRNANYYAVELDDHFRLLATTIGGMHRSNPTWYLVSIKNFVFALFQFSKSAGLDYIGSTTTRILDTEFLRISYEFSEPNWMLENGETSKIVVTILGYKDKNQLHIEEVSFDMLANKRNVTPSPHVEPRNCFVGFE